MAQVDQNVQFQPKQISIKKCCRYSKKEFCELCNHRFSFTPIYSPDMPKRIPLRLVLSGLVGTVGRSDSFLTFAYQLLEYQTCKEWGRLTLIL